VKIFVSLEVDDPSKERLILESVLDKAAVKKLLE
jgi:hypothetical protein